MGWLVAILVLPLLLVVSMAWIVAKLGLLLLRLVFLPLTARRRP